jgi:hypothetical protein
MKENKAVHHYRAFNLEIESQLPLPELRLSKAAPDLAIRFGSVNGPAAGALSDRCFSANQDEVHMYWEEAGLFMMHKGAEMIIQPVEGAPEAVLRMLTLGPGLATILQQRGHLVLHASAVVIAGKAVGFVGWKGQGKSTTAAALFARGCPLLTDDLLALNGKDGQRTMAYPGFPQFKLWPDSAESALAEDPIAMPKLWPHTEKRARSVVDGFATDPAPLGAIYVLADGSELAMHRLSSQETFKQIVSNTFCARYGSRVFEGQTGTAHLQNAASVAANVPVFRLEKPSSLARLDSLADFVVQHVTNL